MEIIIQWVSIIIWGVIMLLFIIASIQYEMRKKENYIVIKLITKIQYELKIYNKRDIIKLVSNEIVNRGRLPYSTTNKLPNDKEFYKIVMSSIVEIEKKTKRGLRKYYYRKKFHERIQSFKFAVSYHLSYL